MIHFTNILKRSWTILWHYRVLWIFGLLLALTMGGPSSSSNGGGSSTGARANVSVPPTEAWRTPVMPEDTPEWARQGVQWVIQNVEPLFTHPLEHIGTFVMIGLIFLAVCLVVGALAAVVRYPAETAVMRMVDEYENTGTKLRFGQGWSLGWNRRAFRLWLVDLILAIPGLIFLLLLAGAAVIVFFSVSSTFQVTNVAGIVAAIGLAFVSLFFLIAVALFVTLVRNFIARAVTLDGLEVRAALSYGWEMFKRNWKSAGLMWLIMIGVSIVLGIVMMIAFFIFIPAYLVLLIPAVVIGIIPGLVIFGIGSLFNGGPLAWVMALVAALPFFCATLFLPLVFLAGWYQVYASNVWTLTYREIKAKESLTGAPEAPVAGEVLQ